MSATAFESFLVRLYVDAEARARFKADPHAELDGEALTDQERSSLLNIDWVGLEMAANSFAKKRQTKKRRGEQTKLTRAYRAFLKMLSP